MARPILFLTDYGVDDEFVGVCHALVARLTPQVRVVDLAHGVPPGDVRRGALALAAVVPYAPPDAVFLAVVDPGVGTPRRAVAVEAGETVLVGPDNGLLSLAWEALGGPGRAFSIQSGRIVLSPVSPTFHGRDVFAPAAAHVAAGGPIEGLGPEVDPAVLIRLPPPRAERHEGGLRCEVLGVDRFGNVQLSAREGDLPERGEPVLGFRGDRVPLKRVRTFGELPEDAFGLLIDSSGWAAVVRNGGSAAAALEVNPGDTVLLSWPAWDSGS